MDLIAGLGIEEELALLVNNMKVLGVPEQIDLLVVLAAEVKLYELVANLRVKPHNAPQLKCLRIINLAGGHHGTVAQFFG